MQYVRIIRIREWLPGLFAILILAMAAAAVPARAGLLDGVPQVSGPQSDLTPRLGSKATPQISAAQAAERARQQHGGKVLSVDLQRNGSQPYYRVKIIDKGNVRVVRVPAN